MNLSQFSPGLFALGLAALAGIVFLLQRLRVRHREVVVVTTLFWREALQEQRARSLVERFRHPLTYLLLLAIAGLLWLGVARPDSNRSAGERHVLLLDASAGMQREGRFELAKEALREQLALSPRDRTEVIVCGEHPRTILAPGEDRALLGSRLEGVVPEPVPASFDRALAMSLLESKGSVATRFTVFGDGYVSSRADVELPDDAIFERAALPALEGPSRGITALSVAPAASGAWDKIDLFIEVSMARTVDASGLDLQVDGQAIADVRSLASIGTGRANFAASDVPAEGGLLVARLPAIDDLSADDAATIRLPNRPRIRVFLAPEAADAAPLLDVLRLDSAIEIVDVASGADVFVGASSPGKPALLLSDSTSQEEAILVGFDSSEAADVALARAVGDLGLDRVDASALAESIGRTISVGAAPSDARHVSLWSELLDPSAGLVTSRTFPALVGRSVRWLSSAESITPYRALGRGVPTRVGETSDGFEVATLAGTPSSLLDSATTTGLSAQGRPSMNFDMHAPDAVAEPGPWRPYTWFLLLALLVLGVEWVLFSRGRVA